VRENLLVERSSTEANRAKMGLGLGLWEVGGDEPKASPGALHNQMTIDADL